MKPLSETARETTAKVSEVAQKTAENAKTAADAAKPSLPSKLQYVSPLRAYKTYADQPVEPWREANHRVGRIGGWRAYAKEIQTGEPAKEAPQDPAKAPAPAADPHAGHHKGATP